MDSENVSGGSLRCPFCGSGAERTGASNRLGTQSVSWLRCKSCNAVNVEMEGWNLHVEGEGWSA